MAEKLIVGDQNCTFNMVTSAMNNAPDVEEVVPKWRKIASDLGVKKDVINKIERKIDRDNWTALDIMDELLRSWRSIASVEATLDILFNILKRHALTDIVNEILKAFKLTDNKGPQQRHPQINQPDFPQQPGKSLYKTNDQGQPSMEAELAIEPAVDSGIPVQESNVDGLFCSKVTVSPTNSSILTVEDMKARRLLASQNTNVFVRVEKRPKRDDDHYKLPGIQEGNGYALILNIIRYKKQGYRKGAQYDSFMLTQLFTQLGYQVIKYDDPNTFYTKDDVEKIVTLFRDYVKTKNPASVVVFLGCHGRLEEIQLSDETFTSLFESVVYQFDAKNCSKLNAVPKIFIIESCRDILHDGPGFHNMFNTIICYATLPGNKAARDENSGTYYVKSLVKVFAEKAYLLNLTQLLDLTEGALWNELIKYGQKIDNRQQCMHVPLGKFGTLYLNL